ncbi:MAG: ribonuclease P protein component [Verrucomicrobia bacterium A1]|nr:MAG: ribonuclease P protein component [Verrucomicrobia bacterium A1]
MPGKPDQRLGRKRRLTRTTDFQQAYAQGRRWIGRYMVLWLREGEGASLRLGVVASRKVGHAVQRARAKRLLREAYRLNRYRFSGLCDIVLIARRSILEAKWVEVVDELLRLAGAAGLVPEGRDQGSEVRREKP